MLLRRSFLAGCIFLQMNIIFSATRLNAEEPQSHFEYIDSKLGIDYRKMAPSPLAEMLSQGEVEWMENASTKYGDKTARLWRKSISKRVADATVNGSIIEKLRNFTPQMLLQFAVGLNPQDPKYGGLWSVGNAYIASKFAGKV